MIIKDAGTGASWCNFTFQVQSSGCPQEWFLFVPMREYTEFALNAHWKRHNFCHSEAGPNIHPMWPCLLESLACAFCFMVKFGKGVLLVFLNDMVQEDLLFGLVDEHKVHLPVHQAQPHSVWVPVCPNSMWLCQHSTKSRVIYLVTGRAFPLGLGMVLTTRLWPLWKGDRLSLCLFTVCHINPWNHWSTGATYSSNTFFMYFLISFMRGVLLSPLLLPFSSRSTRLILI